MQCNMILVPVDFSPHSATALDHAIDLAKQFGGKVHLVHCYDVYVGAVSPYGVTVPQDFNKNVTKPQYRRRRGGLTGSRLQESTSR